MTALLTEFGWITESEAACGLGISEPTLVTYRRRDLAPDHCEVARTIYYNKQVIAAWLLAGGTRGKDQ